MVLTWGGNMFGQLGDGTHANRQSTVAVRDLGPRSEISAGWGYSLALTVAEHSSPTTRLDRIDLSGNLHGDGPFQVWVGEQAATVDGTTWRATMSLASSQASVFLRVRDGTGRERVKTLIIAHTDEGSE